MIQSEPELYQNEGPFGHIPGIAIFTTWNSRQVPLDTLSRTSLTTRDTIPGMSAQRPEYTPPPRPEFLEGRTALIPS